MSGGTIKRVQPASTVMWLGASRGVSSACETDACPYINFFASKTHALDWMKRNPEELGMLLTLQQSLDLARKGWWKPVNQFLATTKVRPGIPNIKSSSPKAIQ